MSASYLSLSLLPTLSLIYRCEYIHGEECDMCFKHCLNPYDPNQQRGT